MEILRVFSVSAGQNKEGEDKSQICIFYVTSVSQNIDVLTTSISPISPISPIFSVLKI